MVGVVQFFSLSIQNVTTSVKHHPPALSVDPNKLAIIHDYIVSGVLGQLRLLTTKLNREQTLCRSDV